MMSKIVATDDTLHGKPRVKGTRIPVRSIYGHYKDGLSSEEIADRYSSLSVEDVEEAINYRKQEDDEKVTA